MNIPNRINILGHTYEIKTNKNREWETGHTAPATSYSRNCTIWIDLNQVESQIESCLIHEILEIINYHLEIKLEHNQISCLETGIYQSLKDNDLLK